MWRGRGLLGLDELRERRPRSIENLLLLPLGLLDLVKVVIVDWDGGAGNEARTGLREPAPEMGGVIKLLTSYLNVDFRPGLILEKNCTERGGGAR